MHIVLNYFQNTVVIEREFEIFIFQEMDGPFKKKNVFQ